MTDEDWAPLPDTDLCQRPGEVADVGKREVAAPAAAPAPAAGAPPAPIPLTVEQQRLLGELKARIAGNPEAASLLAAARRRRAREERKRRAAADPALATTVLTVPPTAPEVAIDERACELDARELEPWFKELPAREQSRLRDQWYHARHQHDGAGLAIRQRLGRAAAHGALVFFVMGVLQSLLLGGFGLVPILTAAGALAGGFAEVLGGGRFTYAFAGGLAFVVVMGPMVFVQPLSLTSLLIASYGMGAVGMDGEMRRSGGFREADRLPAREP